MARINLIQAINLAIVVEGRSTSLALTKGINEVEPEILTHPYIQAHMKAGSVTIVPDPMDPEDIAAAARKIADDAEARAAAARQVKNDKEAADVQALEDAKAKASVPAASVQIAGDLAVTGSVAPAAPAPSTDAPAPADDAEARAAASTDTAPAAE